MAFFLLEADLPHQTTTTPRARLRLGAAKVGGEVMQVAGPVRDLRIKKVKFSRLEDTQNDGLEKVRGPFKHGNCWYLC